MADFAYRLKQVEKRLAFVMDNLRMRAGMATGVLDAQGKSQVKVFDGTLNELYALAKELPTVNEGDMPAPEAILEALKAKQEADVAAQVEKESVNG